MRQVASARPLRRGPRRLVAPASVVRALVGPVGPASLVRALMGPVGPASAVRALMGPVGPASVVRAIPGTPVRMTSKAPGLSSAAPAGRVGGPEAVRPGLRAVSDPALRVRTVLGKVGSRAPGPCGRRPVSPRRWCRGVAVCVRRLFPAGPGPWRATPVWFSARVRARVGSRLVAARGRRGRAASAPVRFRPGRSRRDSRGGRRSATTSMVRGRFLVGMGRTVTSDPGRFLVGTGRT
ncbi:hypothetical protein, partial [Paractinoplanes atraurantiacus]|uniref:hypothetical protein n=1 Tax=Paractinoplanes atraurantiacus TaxID=1036182 RepID=UPI001C540567